jgi:hypothetical protein
MGNFVDKNGVGVVEKSLPFDPPNSAGAVFQFLSKHPKKLGVKIEGAYTEPVLKVRQREPRELDEKSRNAWSFHLFNMQERLAGTPDAEKARVEIEALFRSNRLKLSVGTLLGLLPCLMKAEQARLAGANSYVRRWLANEKLVLQLVVPHDPANVDRIGASRDRNALTTACHVLSRFSDGENGEIDADKIRQEAYEIGRGLSMEDLNALSNARMKLIFNAPVLAEYIGPEAQLLLSLCLTANGKEKSEFLSDASTKTDVAMIVTVLKARTDTNEYQVPASPKSVAEHAPPRRGSMPVFYERETTGNSASTSSTAALPTDQAVKDQTRTSPPANTPPATPGRQLPDTDQDAQSTRTPGTPRGMAYGRAGGSGLNMHATIHQLQNLHRQEAETATASQGPLSAPPPGPPPATPRSQAYPPSSAASVSATSDSSTAGATASSRSSGSQRKEKIDRASPHSSRQKSDGSDGSSHRSARLKPSRRVKSMEAAQPGSSEPADQKALTEARDAARALKADQIKPRSDSAIYKKWEAAEQLLQSVLTLETSMAMRRLVSFCHEVKFEPGLERPSLDRVIRALRPQVKERNAFIAVRDILLAETRGAAAAAVTGRFPELLSLLVFALDAEHAWRRDHKAKSSH